MESNDKLKEIDIKTVRVIIDDIEDFEVKIEDFDFDFGL